VDADLTEEKLKQGTLLHAKLSQVSKRVIGVDIDAKGLGVMQRWGFRDLIQWNVEEIHKLVLPEKIDVIVAGELLEHLANPGVFLRNAKTFLREHGAEMIITTPNAFSWRYFFTLFRRAELVHPDHNFYFSYTTLSNFLNKFAYEVAGIYVYAYPPTGLSTVLNYYRNRLQQRQAIGIAPDRPAQEAGFRRLVKRVKWHASFIVIAIINLVLLKVNPFFADGLIFIVR